jgi:hypothetical protein
VAEVLIAELEEGDEEDEERRNAKSRCWLKVFAITQGRRRRDDAPGKGRRHPIWKLWVKRIRERKT